MLLVEGISRALLGFSWTLSRRMDQKYEKRVSTTTRRLCGSQVYLLSLGTSRVMERGALLTERVRLVSLRCSPPFFCLMGSTLLLVERCVLFDENSPLSFSFCLIFISLIKRSVPFNETKN